MNSYPYDTHDTSHIHRSAIGEGVIIESKRWQCRKKETENKLFAENKKMKQTNKQQQQQNYVSFDWTWFSVDENID